MDIQPDIWYQGLAKLTHKINHHDPPVVDFVFAYIFLNYA